MAWMAGLVGDSATVLKVCIIIVVDWPSFAVFQA